MKNKTELEKEIAHAKYKAQISTYDDYNGWEWFGYKRGLKKGAALKAKEIFSDRDIENSLCTCRVVDYPKKSIHMKSCLFVIKNKEHCGEEK